VVTFLTIQSEAGCSSQLVTQSDFGSLVAATIKLVAVAPPPAAAPTREGWPAGEEA